MRRREFMHAAAGAFAVSALAGRGASFRPQDGATRRFATTPQGRIAYLEQGAGSAALFLHGFPLSSYQWRGALERLADKRRCIAPDLLGLGRTEVRQGQSVSPEAQMNMLLALLDTLATPAADVVASDSGGAVAQLLAARHPARVRSLLLTNCDTEIDSPPDFLFPIIELAKAGRFADDRLAPWLADKTLARSANAIGGRCYADSSHPTDQAIEEYFGPPLSSPARKALLHDYVIALEANPLAGIEPLLERFRAPARIVWGTADAIFSAASPDYLNRTLGNSRGVRRLEGRKLFWPEELPDVVAEEARALWGAE